MADKPKRTPQQRGRYSKRKGSSYEREVSKFLSEFWKEACRGKSQSAHDRAFRPDCDFTPFWVECKHRQKPNLIAALRQAEQEAASVGDPRPGMAFCKAPTVGGKKDEYVVMRPSTLAHILRCLVCASKGSGK